MNAPALTDAAAAPHALRNSRVAEFAPLPTPRELLAELPLTPDAQATYSGVRLEPGIDNIVAHMQPMRNFPVTQHVVGSMVIAVDGDTATATSYTTVHVVRPIEGGGHDVVHRGLSYDDRLVRTADGWRFAERFHQVLWSTSEPTEWPVPTFKP